MDKCPACGRNYMKVGGQTMCKYIGCINYNVIVRRKYANRKKRQKNEILVQEEE